MRDERTVKWDRASYKVFIMIKKIINKFKTDFLFVKFVAMLFI